MNSDIALEELEEGDKCQRSPGLRFIVEPEDFIMPNLNIGMRVGLLLIGKREYNPRRVKPKL